MKKLLLLFILLIFPISTFAYSSKVVLGGKTLGIKVNTKGVMVIGFYKVNGKYNKGTIPMQNGDYIIQIEGTNVNSAEDITKEIEKNINKETINVTFVREGITKNTKLRVIKSGGVVKTGLFVKSSIMGIGTLSYIDPETKIFGSLGHEIIDNSGSKKVEIKSGEIFQSYITGIDKSIIGTPGSKTAKFNYNNVYGNIFKNTKYGIFGIYNAKIDPNSLIDIGKPVIGLASVKTVLKGEDITSFDIEITKINDTSDIKNITFKITSDDIINLTGGVIQGMSGSPIVQNDKLVGVLTHVIVDNPYTGYGLFIDKMLYEGEN